LKSVQNKIEVTSTLIIIILKIKLIEIHSKKNYVAGSHRRKSSRDRNRDEDGEILRVGIGSKVLLVLPYNNDKH
jgi:hypothetical protein